MVRGWLCAACALLVFFACLARAHAQSKASVALPHEVPAAPPPAKPTGIVGGLVNVVSMLRPPSREKTDRDRDVEIWVLAMRGNGVSGIGASLAGFGAATGATISLVRRGGKVVVPVTFGPKLFCGGGGVTISLKW